MIKKIGVENFQGFAGGQSVNLAPITLVFGPNASGKSSIGRAIAMLLENQRNSGGAFYPSEPPLVEDFGPFEQTDLVKYTKSGDRPLVIDGIFEFGYEWAEPTGYSSAADLMDLNSIVVRGKSSSPDWEALDRILSSGELDDGSGEQAIPFEVNFRVTDAPELFGSAVSMNDWDGETWEGPSLSVNFSSGEQQVIFDVFSAANKGLNLFNPVEFHPRDGIAEFLQVVGGMELNADELGMLRVILNDHPPVRNRFTGIGFEKVERAMLGVEGLKEPQFEYMLENLEESLGSDSQGKVSIAYYNIAKLAHRAVDLISNLQFNLVKADRVRPNRIDTKFFHGLDKSNLWLSKLTDSRYQFIQNPIKSLASSNKRLGYENLVHDLATGHKGDFQNVGAGLAHIWHILGALSWSHYGLVYLEQPELHLHPKMQGELAEVFADFVKTSKGQIVIETHSENLLLAFQRLIRTGVLAVNDVSIVYVEKIVDEVYEDDATKHTFNSMANINLSSAGELLDPFPESFASMRANYLFS